MTSLFQDWKVGKTADFFDFIYLPTKINREMAVMSRGVRVHTPRPTQATIFVCGGRIEHEYPGVPVHGSETYEVEAAEVKTAASQRTQSRARRKRWALIM